MAATTEDGAATLWHRPQNAEGAQTGRELELPSSSKHCGHWLAMLRLADYLWKSTPAFRCRKSIPPCGEVPCRSSSGSTLMLCFMRSRNGNLGAATVKPTGLMTLRLLFSLEIFSAKPTKQRSGRKRMQLAWMPPVLFALRVTRNIHHACQLALHAL